MKPLRTFLFLIACLAAFFAGRRFGLGGEPLGAGASIARAAQAGLTETRAASDMGAEHEGGPDEKTLAMQLAQIGARPASRRLADRMLELLLVWARTDPRAAAEHARTVLRPPWRDEALARLLAVWAGRKPDAAWHYVNSALPGEFGPVDAVLREIGRTAPERAWSFATEHASRNPREAAGAYVAAMKGGMHEGRHGDLSSLLGTAILPPEVTNSDYGLHDLLADDWARYDAIGAAKWVQSLAPGSHAYRQALTGLGDSWTSRDPAAAADFALGLDESPERSRILRTAANEWAIAQPGRAGEWLEKYQATDDYDHVAAAVATAERNMDADFTRSIGWAGRIGDMNLRLNSYTRILDRWATRDPDEARRFLQDSTLLPADVRRELHERLMDVGTLSH